MSGGPAGPARPRRHARPHARLGRRVVGGRDPGPGRGRGLPRRHRHRGPRADRRGRRGPGDGARPRAAGRGRGGRGGLDARRPPARPVPRVAGPVAARASPGPSRRSTTRAASRSRPTRSSPTRCAPRASPSGSCSRRTTRGRAPTRSRRSTRPPSAATATRPSSGSRGSTTSPSAGNSDAHIVERGRQRLDDVPGPDRGGLPPGDRLAADRPTTGRSTARGEQLGVYRRQLGKYARGWRATVGGRIRGDGTGRDLGYPGGTLRPPRYDPGRAPGRRRATREDRARLAVRLPAARAA